MYFNVQRKLMDYCFITNGSSLGAIHSWRQPILGHFHPPPPPPPPVSGWRPLWTEKKTREKRPWIWIVSCPISNISTQLFLHNIYCHYLQWPHFQTQAHYHAEHFFAKIGSRIWKGLQGGQQIMISIFQVYSRYFTRCFHGVAESTKILLVMKDL